jgi:periplasmic protein TonB
MLAPILVSVLITLQSGAIQRPQEKPWPPAGVVPPGNGVISPQLVKDVKPNYTADAMGAKIAGTVLLEVVVLADGKVGDVRVTQSLDREFGLDDQAVTAAKLWKFKPGTKDGVAIPVVVKIEMTFSLRK